MLQVLNSPRLASAKPLMYNDMFLKQQGPPSLEPRWRECNGLRDLRYRVARRKETRLSSDASLVHVTAVLQSG